MRLIDADKLMEKLGECFYDTTNPAARRAAHDTMALCQSLVEEQHTAYDVDKVCDKMRDEAVEMWQGFMIHIGKACEIVESGGK